MTPETELSKQRRMWNAWNRMREQEQDEAEQRQARTVLAWLDELQRNDLRILDVGCGAGWMEPLLSPYGRITATDLADEVLDRARSRNPEIDFIAGDFMSLDLPDAHFDVLVSLEVLSHVADQKAFAARCASLLRPDGLLMLSTQNRPVLERFNNVPPPMPGQLRRWVDAPELRALLTPHFDVLELFSVTLRCDTRHPLRLLTSRKVDAKLRPHLGGLLEAARSSLERRGYGWTLMALARRRSDPA